MTSSKPQKFASLAITAALIVGSLIYLELTSIQVAMAIVITSTITGWNVPDAPHIGYGLMSILLPLFFGSLFAGMLLMLRRGGDFVVTIFLFGVVLGATFGTLTNLIPLAFTIVCWVCTVLWVWQGAQGGSQAEVLDWESQGGATEF